jgi:tetratricopeptide (TPR) repeat protein
MYLPALLNRGDMFARAGKLESALKDYQLAAREDAAQAMPRIARLLVQSGDIDQAIKLCSDTPRELLNAELLFTLGLSWRKKGDLPRALGAYTAALERDPRYGWAYFERGQLRAQLGDFEHALEDFTQASKLEPRTFEPLLGEQHTRSLRIHNKSGEKLRVFIQYETQTAEGNWQWFPGPPDSGKYLTRLVPMNQSAFVIDQGRHIKARRVRAWAEAVPSEKSWAGYRDKDLLLAPDKYLSPVEIPFDLPIP